MMVVAFEPRSIDKFSDLSMMLQIALVCACACVCGCLLRVLFRKYSLGKKLEVRVRNGLSWSHERLGAIDMLPPASVLRNLSALRIQSFPDCPSHVFPGESVRR